MIKTLQTTLKQDKEQFKVPRSVQDTIPIRRLWPDGVFQFGSKYSKTLRFSDINYAIASKEDKTAMFLSYSELLNALDTGSTTKITINNKRLNRRNFEQEILIPTRGDFLDGGRAEYNAMLLDKVTDSSNSVVQERYITLSAHKKNIEEARTFFDRTVNDVTSRLNHMDSRCEELDAVERLRILHDFYRVGEETQFQLDLRECMKQGRSFKDAVCPDSMEFKKDHFVMGNKYGRVLFLKEYASYIKDSMINELTSLNRSLMLSIDIIPVPTDEAVREMQNRLLGVETNVTNWQRRQNSNNNFSAVVPYDLEQQRKETREMLDDLTTRDQRMMFAVVTLVHLADSKEELDSDTETLQSIARKHLCQLNTLNWQQADGLVTALPLGLRRIDALRTLTTEALAVLMPFKAQEIWDRGGVYYGQNAISKNLIVGMLVVLDSIFNRIIRNRGLKRNTWIYIDEIYLLFQHEYSANFLFTLWKRMRKYQACGTGISQNIEDLLQSHTARTMLANSEFLIMLNQAATDREELAHLLNISDNQLSYITNVDSGRGLIKCGSAIVPFVDHFPKNKLYRLMTTKPSDLAA